jgi:hypothetical protein
VPDAPAPPEGAFITGPTFRADTWMHVQVPTFGARSSLERAGNIPGFDVQRGKPHDFPLLCDDQLNVAKIKQAWRSIQHLARNAAPLEDAPQLRERFELDLAHALAGEAELCGEVFQREHFDVVQPVAVLDHETLLL